MGKQAKTKAAIYMRISKDPREKSPAIERQREDCLAMVEYHGWELYAEYQDKSKSAYSGVEREGFERMLRDFKAGKFQVICAWKLDRLTRSTHTFSDMVFEMAEQHLRICTTDTGDLDLTRADSRFLAQQFVNFAEFESARKSERIIRANQQRAKKGTMKKGYRCFGYDRDYQIIPEEAVVVRAIYDAFLKGSSINSITKAISGSDEPGLPHLPTSDNPSAIRARELGKKPPKNTGWNRTSIRQVLTNPKYAGYVAYIPWATYKKINVRADWADYIVKDPDGTPLDASWEPIVDRETWWSAQKRLDDLRNMPRRDGSPRKHTNTRKYFGTGLFRCSVCGQPMRVSSGSYRCDGHVSRRHAMVDEYVLEVVRARLAMPDLAEILPKKEDPRLEEIAAEIAECSGEIKRVRHDYKRGVIDGDLYHEIVTEQQERIAILDDERKGLMEDASTMGVLTSDDPVAAFDSLTDPGQIHSVVDYLMEVVLHPHKRGEHNTVESLEKDVEIRWKEH